MTLFNKKIAKTIGALSAMVFFVSCTNEIPEEAGDLIDNNSFVRDTLYFTPQLTTKSVDTVRTNLLSTHLLGQYTSPNFGSLQAGFVGQLLPDTYKKVGDAVISDVKATLEMPLLLSLKEDSSEVYEITNFLGDYSAEMSLRITTFTTYLETFNQDGSTRTYYNDGTNNAGTKEDLGTETLLANATGITFSESYEALDTLSIPLGSSEFDFKTDFIDRYDEADILNTEDMVRFFKGIKVTATTTGNGMIVPFNLYNTKLKIKFNETTVATEEGQEDTVVQDSLMFSFGSRVLYSLYEDNNGYANEPNKVYVQGAGGYEVSVNIEEFISDNLVAFQSEQWILNQGLLKVYLDNVTEETLSNFYIYAIDKEDNVVALDDYGFFGANAVDAIVRYEDTENETDPFVYFFITDFIKDVLSYNKAEDTGIDIKELRIKAREPSESTVVDLRSSTAKGAVFLNDPSSEKAPQLEVIYSRVKED
ncbi:DUF4270 family protein [Ochrovirga pacifica]|uniref:DUF4270 family protein n=1 Tax=Ochrovirga pacifica TaxID=1042376 RepID=UPI0002559B09|nr:DUF4270 family protein [Ochrovirga pacifica]